MSSPLRDDNPADGGRAAGARLPCPCINVVQLLKGAAIARAIYIIGDGGTAMLNGQF